MLSLVQYNTSQSIIVCCNVIIGLGLGFMAMSLTSSVKYLPINKAGIGSGIVNASRYVGQAIGMALLVTILNSNVNIAKTQIKETAYKQIEKRVLSTDVKKVAKKEIAKPSIRLRIVIVFQQNKVIWLRQSNSCSKNR